MDCMGPVSTCELLGIAGLTIICILTFMVTSGKL